MSDKLMQAQQRALQYWFIDGLAEIAMGLVFLLLAVLFAFWETISTTPWGFLIVLLVGFPASFGLRLLIQRIKERSTYPRTGYVAPQSGLERKSSFALALGFALLLLAVNFFASTLAPTQNWNWSTLFAGLVAGFILGWTGYVTKMRELMVLAGVSLLGGIALSFLGFADLVGAGILIAVLGLILLVIGIRTRRAYLRENPQPDL